MNVSMTKLFDLASCRICINNVSIEINDDIIFDSAGKLFAVEEFA